MGIMQSKYNSKNTTVVIQTGKMRTEYINSGVNYFDNMERFPQGVVHRFLPKKLETKYEAVDFIKKFALDNCEYFSIHDAGENLLKLRENTDMNSSNMLLDKINIVVSCGSTSLHALKITPDGGKILLPVTDLNKDDTSIKGDKDDPNLSVETLSNFGSGSKNQDIAVSVLNFLKANAFSNKLEKTNVIFVNKIGYSIMGFNPTNGDPYIPNYTEKVVSLKYPVIEKDFTDNNGQTALVHVLSKLITGEIDDPRLNLVKTAEENMMYLVASQCKVKVNSKHEELSGQWANVVVDMIKNEPELELINLKNIGFIMDLGGSSGTLYNVNADNICNKVTGKTFMKIVAPNDFITAENTNIDGFFEQFSKEFEKLFD